jgi:ABC-type nickel/cobalt efflux system permease component RcnA
MRIARPILLVTTPLGVVLGLREAWRLAGPRMAMLMAVMLLVVGAFVWMTARRIRQEHASSALVHQPEPDEAEHQPDRIGHG